MTNTQMKSRRHVEMRSGAVVHTDVAKMNKHQLGGAKKFVMFLDEVTRFIRAVLIKSKDEAAELVKEHVIWMER